MGIHVGEPLVTEDGYTGIDVHRAARIGSAGHGGQILLSSTACKPTAFAVSLLRQKGLIEFFGVVFGGDAFERKKPDPLPLLKTCEALGSVPPATLQIVPVASGDCCDKPAPVVVPPRFRPRHDA